MFANTQMMGMDMGFPDVCLTPPVAAPIPYPNMGLGPMTLPFVPNVLMFCAPSHNMFCQVVVTLGDQPGIMLGVASGLVMGPSRRLTAAFTCIVGGAPLTRMTSFGLQNNTNCPGVRLVPSQPKVIVLKP
jgi:hypothetical protein